MIRFIKTHDGKMVNLQAVLEVADNILSIEEEEDDLIVKWPDGYQVRWPAYGDGRHSMSRFLSTLDDLKKIEQTFTGLYFSSNDMLDKLIPKVLHDAKEV